VAGEIFKTHKEVLKLEKSVYRKAAVREKGKRVALVFFGSLAIVGFVVTLYFLIEMIVVSQQTVGIINEEYIYGFLIATVISFVISVITIWWYGKFRKKYLKHET